MSFKIGNVEIKNQVILAPMAGVTDHTFRTIALDMGAGLVVSEMISSEALVRDNKKTWEMLGNIKDEHPLSVQIFGGSPKTMGKAAKMLCERIPEIALIDINMGCPVPKVALRSEAGSALLKDPDKISKIVKEVVKNSSVPVTVKIRIGWDDKNINAVEVAKIIEKAGASAIAVHGRTRKEGYSGVVNKEEIKKVKEAVSIPVIANGDIRSYKDAKEMLDYTKCDAIMIGRGTLGNPWLIKECVDYLEKGVIPKPVSIEEKILMMERHFKKLEEDKNPKVATLEFRTHALWYLKGLPNNKLVKDQICKAKTGEEIISILKNYLEECV